MEAANYIIQKVKPADRPHIEVEMRFLSAINPIDTLMRMNELTKVERTFRETLDMGSNVRTRIDMNDGSIECVKKDQLARLFDVERDRYVHINREVPHAEEIMESIDGGIDIVRTSLVPSVDAVACPRIDITKKTSTYILEVECAPFTDADTDGTIMTKCKNFEETCKTLHVLLGSPLGQFKQPMPIALTRDRLRLATGCNYLTSHKVDGERRLLELRLHLTKHTLGRRASFHLYASRTMTILRDIDLTTFIRTTKLLPLDIEELMRKATTDIFLFIDVEEVVTTQGVKTMQILDVTRRGQPEQVSIELRLRLARDWLPLLRNLLIPSFVEQVTVKPYFKESIFKTRCAKSLIQKELKIPVDGLIFTPILSRNNSVFRWIYKWKETAASTIDLLYRSGDLLVAVTDGDEWRSLESILQHFPSTFCINHGSLIAHTVSDGTIVECRIVNDEIHCVGIRHDKVYPNTLKTCLHTLTVVKENISLSDIIAHFEG